MRRLVQILLVVGLLLVAPAASHAAGSRPEQTLLRIEVPAQVPENRAVSVTVRLTDKRGRVRGADANEVIRLYVDDAPFRRERTNATGVAVFRIAEPPPPGEHRLTAVYYGSEQLAPSTASATLRVIAAPLVPGPSKLTITPPGAVYRHSATSIGVRLWSNASGYRGASGNEPLVYYVDGVRVRQVRTDSDGAAELPLPRELAPGHHTITVEYSGSKWLRPAEAVARFRVLSIEEPAAPARITLSAPATSTISEKLVITARITSKTGENQGAVANEVVQLYVDGAALRRRTDDDGVATFILHSGLPEGTHKLVAAYPGSRALAPASASGEIRVGPARLTIQVVPALGNIPFRLDGHEFVSDSRGIARIPVYAAGTHKLDIAKRTIELPDMRASFSRWSDDVFTPARTVEIPRTLKLEVGFVREYLVSQVFIAPDGSRVPSGRISSLTLGATDGKTYRLSDGRPRWYPASRVVRRAGGLEASRIKYSVLRVVMSGSNVVNQAQQRFYPKPNDQWRIHVLLFSAEFRGTDAVFGFPIGQGIELVSPDSKARYLSFGDDTTARAEGLARGMYQARVTGAPGYAPFQALALSRRQDARLIVISYLDVAAGVVSALAVMIGLLLIGRQRHWLARLSVYRRRSGVVRVRQEAPGHD